jgi:hypothetical protein
MPTIRVRSHDNQSSTSRRSVESVIVVLVPHKNPPSVLDTTREQLVLTVRDTSATGSYVASLPPGSVGSDFEGAWSALTRDMKTARYFETVEEAMRYYASLRDGLSWREHACIIGALKRLGLGKIAAPQ